MTEFTNVARLSAYTMYVGFVERADKRLAALLVYDIILMFGREKRYIWDAKFRLSTVLYLLVRYPVIVYQVYQIWMHPTSARVCPFTRFIHKGCYLHCLCIILWSVRGLSVIAILPVKTEGNCLAAMLWINSPSCSLSRSVVSPLPLPSSSVYMR